MPTGGGRWSWKQHVIELLVLVAFGLYSAVLLFVTAVYYHRLTLHCSAANADGPNSHARCISSAKTVFHANGSVKDHEKGIAGNAEEVKKVYGLIFGDHLDAWRVLSILGMGYGIFNVLATLCILYVFIVSKRMKAKEVRSRKTRQSARRHTTCMRFLFGLCTTLTLVFSIISFLTLLLSGAVNDEEPIEPATQWARAYFGVVGIPGFSFLILFIFSLFTGFNCSLASPLSTMKKAGSNLTKNRPGGTLAKNRGKGEKDEDSEAAAELEGGEGSDGDSDEE